jgi:hypothetical protein
MPTSEGRKPYNILKSTQLGSVQQDQLNNIQKATYIEKQMHVQNNWKELIEIKKAQLATKTFGYGLPGPHSFAIQATNADATQTILQPSSDDEVFMIDSLSVKETAGSTAGAYLSITDGSSESIIWADTSIAANQIDVVSWSGDLYLTKGAYLKLTVASGAVQVGITYSKIIY